MARRSAQSTVAGSARNRDVSSDAEGDESQRVLLLKSLLQTPTTKNKELQDLKAKVATDQQELKILLEQRKREAEEASMRRRNELTRSILDALQTPNSSAQENLSTLGGTKIARNAIFKSVAYVITSSEDLVAEYERLDKLIEGLRDAEPEGVAEKWTENVDKTARLLRLGAGTAIRNVKKVLGADIANDEAEEADENTERMEGLENMELNYDFHKSLKYAEKGVKKMVKGLPQEEDG